MPSNNPSQRATEISEELEIFPARSVNYSDKAAKILSNAIGKLKFVLYALTRLAGGARRKQSAMLLLRLSWPVSRRNTCRIG